MVAGGHDADAEAEGTDAEAEGTDADAEGADAGADADGQEIGRASCRERV